MGGIDPTVITHKLNTSPSFKPVKQKRRSFTLERQKAISKEVRKLLQAGAIQEMEYPEWLANVVLVKKANDKWRLGIDFTDINKACPRDNFPLPRIDLIVDATTGHELLSFMDAFLMSAKLIYVLSSFHMLFYAFNIHIHVKLIKFTLNLVF